MLSSQLPPFSNLTTKSTLNTPLEYTQDLDENLKTLYSKLITNKSCDHKSYDTNQQNLSYSTLLMSCSAEILDCKFQIADLNMQLTLSPAQVNTAHAVKTP